MVWRNWSLTVACIRHVVTSRCGEAGFLGQLGARSSFTPRLELCHDFLNGPGKESAILAWNKQWERNLLNQSFFMCSDAFLFSASLFLEGNEAVKPELYIEECILFIIFLAWLLVWFLPLQVRRCHVGGELQCMCLEPAILRNVPSIFDVIRHATSAHAATNAWIQKRTWTYGAAQVADILVWSS